tara:strand:+ start:414 stop:530 length:117 start_codon:yes stop_codon:yes gene_type:complete
MIKRYFFIVVFYTKFYKKKSPPTYAGGDYNLLAFIHYN